MRGAVVLAFVCVALAVLTVVFSAHTACNDVSECTTCTAAEIAECHQNACKCHHAKCPDNCHNTTCGANEHSHCNKNATCVCIAA